METLVWTRGRTLLLDCVDKRLKCPSCGDRMVRVVRAAADPIGERQACLGSP
jgi:hypothetical protein